MNIDKLKSSAQIAKAAYLAACNNERGKIDELREAWRAAEWAVMVAEREVLTTENMEVA